MSVTRHRRARPTPEEVRWSKLKKLLRWQPFYQEKYGSSFELIHWACCRWHADGRDWDGGQYTSEDIARALLEVGVKCDEPSIRPIQREGKPDQEPLPQQEAGAGSGHQDRGTANSRVGRPRREGRRTDQTSSTHRVQDHEEQVLLSDKGNGRATGNGSDTGRRSSSVRHRVQRRQRT